MLVDPKQLETLFTVIRQVSPCAQTFNLLNEWARVIPSRQIPDQFKLVILPNRRATETEKYGRFNLPATLEVAAIMIRNENGYNEKRIIVLKNNGSRNNAGKFLLDEFSINHRSYVAVSYALLFPYGDDGWNSELQFISVGLKKSRVTSVMLYAWRLFVCEKKYSTLLKGGRLFQKYLVDQYCKIEAERLMFFRLYQQKLRAYDFSHLRELFGDFGNLGDEAEVVRNGGIFILLSTYVGGDRYMRHEMHDVIAISKKGSSRNLSYQDMQPILA